MIEQLDLDFGPIVIDRTKYSKALKEIYGEKCAEKILGLWVCEDSRIYLARELNNSVKFQTLVHEVAEAMYSMLELKWDHDKIKLLELMLNSILRNKLFVEDYWRSQQDAAHDKNLRSTH